MTEATRWATPSPLTFLPTDSATEFSDCANCGATIERHQDRHGGTVVVHGPGVVTRWSNWEHTDGGPACVPDGSGKLDPPPLPRPVWTTTHSITGQGRAVRLYCDGLFVTQIGGLTPVELDELVRIITVGGAR